jgi:hypothetical protein
MSRLRKSGGERGAGGLIMAAKIDTGFREDMRADNSAEDSNAASHARTRA